MVREVTGLQGCINSWVFSGLLSVWAKPAKKATPVWIKSCGEEGPPMGVCWPLPPFPACLAVGDRVAFQRRLWCAWRAFCPRLRGARGRGAVAGGLAWGHIVIAGKGFGFWLGGSGRLALFFGAGTGIRRACLNRRHGLRLKIFAFSLFLEGVF